MFKDILAQAEAKANIEKELELKTPAELIGDWAVSIEGDLDRPLTTSLPSFDKCLKNKLRGTVGAYIGYGGSKKSLFALQALRESVLAHSNKCTGIYANMEMAVFQMMSRLIDMSIEVQDYNYNVSSHFETEYKNAYQSKNKVAMAKILEVLNNALVGMYGNNLYINSQTGMTIDDFDKLCKRVKAKNGILDMLVIDGLSMMSGSGNETERYTTSSKELKDLAKHHNIYIPLICHLSKGAKKHTRDVMQYIRGSEKILDNVDFIIQMSLIVDEFRSSDDNVVYDNKLGWARLFNKRGNGDTIDVVYDFNPYRLLISESKIKPEEIYNPKEQKKSFNLI